MEDKASRNASIDDAMKSVQEQIKSCKETVKELKEERKNQIKHVNAKHKESLKVIDVAQSKLNTTLKKLKKFKKNPDVELDDIVLLQKKKNTSSAIKKQSKLERKNSEKELKEASKAAKLERKNSEKELKEAAKLERKNSQKEMKAAKIERKNSAKNLKEMEKTAKLERKNSEKEMKEIRKLERKNSIKDLKEAKKREELEAKQAAIALKKNKSSIEFMPSKRAALLVSTNDTKKSSAIASMKNFLINKLGFEDSDIMTLSNMTKNANKMKILESLDNLVECANEQDCGEIWFFYSGDGVVVKNAKEEDAEDAIIPCDYKEKGIINSMTFNSRMENIAKGVKVYVVFDCCHNENFLETEFEYCGGSDVKSVNENPTAYNSDITVFSLRTLEPVFSGRGIINNTNPHILARTFIEHYNECVEDNCSAVTTFSMLHDIRDYMIFNEIDLVPVMYCPTSVENNTVLLSIK